MGILDDIQQLQMQGVQNGAQQAGFTQPQSSDQPVSQIGTGQAQQPQPDQPAQPQSQAGRLQSSMADYAGILLQQAQQLTQPDTGFRKAFGAGMLHAVGMATPREQQLQNVNAQLEALRGATGVQQSGLQQQQLDLQRSMVTLPNGMSVPLALAKTLFPAYLRSDTSQANNERNNATKKLVNGYNDDGSVRPLSSLSVPQQLKAQASSALNLLNKARTDSVNMNTKLAPGKLAVLEANARANLSRAASAAGMEKIAADKFAADYVNGMQDDDGNPIGLNQYKAQTAGDKAPAAMLQQAEYAKGGLDQFKDARGAIEKLRAHGVLTGVPANKMEEMLFGNGLIDPSLSPEDQKLVGQARAGLGLGATAALRAHTGRGSREIYQDFTKRFGIGQGNQALDAALDQGEKLLIGYAAAGSNQAIHALRHPGGSAPSSSVITLTDGGKSYKIPAALKANFLKDHPNAR